MEPVTSLNKPPKAMLRRALANSKSRLNVAVQQGAVTIPQDAVQYGSQGTYVYTVDDNNKAQLKMLKLGAVDNGLIAVEEGLKAGDLVILEGLDRLRPGRDVEVVQKPAQG